MVDPWRERTWEEPSEGDDSRLLISWSKKQGALRVRAERGPAAGADGLERQGIV